MMDTKILEDLMQRKVSRREFLSYVGAGILAIVGVTSFLKTLGVNKSTSTNRHTGYGSGPYGGKKHG